MPTLPLLNIFAEMVSPLEQRAVSALSSHNTFSLDFSAVAGFFGGDTSVAGMATVNLIAGRRWVGWYNNPGSYEIAKQYGPLGNTKLFNSLFPNGEHEPSQLFKLDSREGPQFVGAHSGTVLQRTGFLSHLIMRKAVDESHVTTQFLKGAHNSGLAAPPKVTIFNTRHAHALESSEIHPLLPESRTVFTAFVPIVVSVGACIVCAVVGDRSCSASIAVGIVAHGFACYIIGSGEVTVTYPYSVPSPNSPPGDGVLKGDGEWVILLGTQNAVNAITRGRFCIQYGERQADGTPGHAKWRQGYTIGNPEEESGSDTVGLLTQTYRNACE